MTKAVPLEFIELAKGVVAELSLVESLSLVVVEGVEGF